MLNLRISVREEREKGHPQGEKRHPQSKFMATVCISNLQGSPTKQCDEEGEETNQ